MTDTVYIQSTKVVAISENVVDIIEVARQGPPGSGSGGGGGTSDHGELEGLADDDHTQYHNNSRGDARYYTKSQVDTSLSGKADTSHTHAIADVTNLQTALDGKADTSHTHTASQITDFNTAADARITAQKGSALGLATLDAGGKVPSAQLPSFVDDILEYADLASFPVTGESGKIYVALDTNRTYRWSGSSYTAIVSGTVDSVFGRVGAVIAQAGDYTTAMITEVTNLFFTNARAIGATLTGYVSGAGVISSADSILQAIQKLNGNIAAIPTGIAIAQAISGSTQGSILFVGSGGILQQANADFFYDATNKNIGIRTATPDAKLVMDFNTTTQGFRPPVLNNTQMYAISSPPTGSLVVHSDTNKIWGYGIGYGFGWKPLYTPILSPSYFEETTMWFQQQGQYGTKAIALKAPVSIPIDLPDVFLPSRTGTIALIERITSPADATTVTPNCDTGDVFDVAALSANFTLANPTGTPRNWQPLTIIFTTAAARTITYGSGYIGSTDTPLPTATTGGGATEIFGFRYSTRLAKWMLVAINRGY